ncbi:MAG: hypothetical protein QF570_17990 [Myxococcota bacterium]|nr:hypothetical protein [Myxococcota bacterium]
MVAFLARLGGAGGAILVLAIAIAAFPGAGRATEPAEPQADGAAPADAPPKPKVDLGRLLQLPDSYQKPVESRRGIGQAEWQRRFETVRLELLGAQTALQKAKAELGAAATDSSQWSVAAPGTAPNPENTPLSYKLRQEIRRQRENVKRSEKQLRALEIEADLAEVPLAWRVPHIATAPESRIELSTEQDTSGIGR